MQGAYAGPCRVPIQGAYAGAYAGLCGPMRAYAGLCRVLMRVPMRVPMPVRGRSEANFWGAPMRADVLAWCTFGARRGCPDLPDA
jgi:hypothetical protein